MQTELLSIVLFSEGLITGIMLTVMLGPVTMMILKYGMQVNKAAGVWAATGTWISDILFIAGTYWMTVPVSAWTSQPGVERWIYVTGGSGLIIMGILLIRIKQRNSIPGELKALRSYTQAFAGGFLVNSLSPFTLFFWLGAAVLLHMQEANAIWYYAGVMLTLAAGDFVKAWLAPKIMQRIKADYIYWVQVIAGSVIAATGLLIIGKGILEWQA